MSLSLSLSLDETLESPKEFTTNIIRLCECEESLPIDISVPYVYNFPIETAWKILRDQSHIVKANKELLKNFALLKGENCWSLHSEFEYEWIGVSKISGKVIKLEDKPNFKLISWKLFLNIGIQFIRTFILNKKDISKSKSNEIVVQVNIEKAPGEWNEAIDLDETAKNYFKNVELVWLKNAENYINKYFDFLENTQHFVINHNIEDVFSVFMNVENNFKLSDTFVKEVKFKDDGFREGSLFKFTLNSGEIVYHKVVRLKKDYSKECILAIETCSLSDMIKQQRTEFIFAPLGKDTTKFTAKTVFLEKIDERSFQRFIEEKSKFLRILVDSASKQIQNNNNNKIFAC